MLKLSILLQNLVYLTKIRDFLNDCLCLEPFYFRRLIFRALSDNVTANDHVDCNDWPDTPFHPPPRNNPNLFTPPRLSTSATIPPTSHAPFSFIDGTRQKARVWNMSGEASHQNCFGGSFSGPKQTFLKWTPISETLPSPPFVHRLKIIVNSEYQRLRKSQSHRQVFRKYVFWENFIRIMGIWDLIWQHCPEKVVFPKI